MNLQQDQENFEEHSTMEQQDRAINRQELAKEDETSGSVLSNPRILIKLPKMPEKVVWPPPSMVAPAELIVRAEEKNGHYCKECNKGFSSGKALGGHMSSAHVQANKDCSYKKLKSKMMMKAQLRYSGSSYSGSGLEDNACVVCGKRFPSQKSLYGHMRCHPDRDWRGMEPPVEHRMESSEASTEPGFEHTGLDQDSDFDDGVDLGSDAVARPVDFLSTLKGWPVTAKRGRSARPGTVSPPKYPSGSEEEEALSAGHELLRLLKRNLGSGERIGGEVDQGMMSSDSLARPWPESDGEVNFKKHSSAPQGPESDDGVNFKKRKRDYDHYPVKEEIVCEMAANHEPEPETKDRKKARDYKMKPRAPKVKIWNTNGVDDIRKVDKIEINDKGKGKVKVLLSEPETKLDESEPEDDLYFGAISVLANGKRESLQYHHSPTDFQKPVPESSGQSKGAEKLSPSRQKDNSGLSSPEKHICITCKKVFTSHQALGGHRSSHNKFRMNIFNTNGNNISNNIKDTKMEIVTNIPTGGDDDQHVCKVCDKIFPTRRALGGHKKCHNSGNGDDDNSNNNNNNKGEEKVVRGFDLNMLPDENGAEDIEDPSRDKFEV